jgi:hypothetical protein
MMSHYPAMEDTTDSLDVAAIYPRRNALVPIIRIAPEVVRFGYHPQNIQMSISIQKIFDELNGDRSARAITKNLDPNDLTDRVFRLGLQTGVLLDCNAIPDVNRWLPTRTSQLADADFTHLKISTPENSNQTLVERLDIRHETLIHIAGNHYLAREIHRAAIASGLRVTSDPRAAGLIVFPSISHPEVPDHDFSELETRTHLHVGIRHCRSTIGPLVTPGTSSCIRCAFLHRRDNDSTWPYQAIGWRNSIEQSTADPLLINLTACFAIAITRQWIEAPKPKDQLFANIAWESTLPLPQFAPMARPPHPLCGCQLSIPAERR